MRKASGSKIDGCGILLDRNLGTSVSGRKKKNEDEKSSLRLRQGCGPHSAQARSQALKRVSASNLRAKEQQGGAHLGLCAWEKESSLGNQRNSIPKRPDF